MSVIFFASVQIFFAHVCASHSWYAFITLLVECSQDIKIKEINGCSCEHCRVCSQEHSLRKCTQATPGMLLSLFYLSVLVNTVESWPCHKKRLKPHSCVMDASPISLVNSFEGPPTSSDFLELGNLHMPSSSKYRILMLIIVWRHTHKMYQYFFNTRLY